MNFTFIETFTPFFFFFFLFRQLNLSVIPHLSNSLEKVSHPRLPMSEVPLFFRDPFSSCSQRIKCKNELRPGQRLKSRRWTS